MGIFLLVVGLCIAVAGVAVLALASGGPFPFEAVASYITLALGSICVILGVVHMKTKLMEKFIQNTRTPFWLNIIGLLLIFLIIYYLLGGGFLSIVAAVISLIITIIVVSIYALWALVERVTKRKNRVPFWFYIVVLLPVLVLTVFLDGALWR